MVVLVLNVNLLKGRYFMSSRTNDICIFVDCFFSKKKKTKQILFPMSSLTFLLEETSYALSNPELTGCLACVAVTEWDT